MWHRISMALVDCDLDAQASNSTVDGDHGYGCGCGCCCCCCCCCTNFERCAGTPRIELAPSAMKAQCAYSWAADGVTDTAAAAAAADNVFADAGLRMEPC